ncbi:MAG: HlyD family efflux transporter periplasmic adaptor subunit [Clostridia bacterium]|nr:HlyD family efflux transporter periplasmic adaptor subunit [Clostridia bacterium]
MKRLFWLALCLMLLSSASALASTADASIVAPNTIKITAPYAGVLTPFDWRSGDPVADGDILFTYQTTPVYAALGGKVVAIHAAAGDDAQGIISRYGALAVIEPIHPLYIAADNSQAYDKDENKYLHAGELLYLKNGNDKGTGRVTSVDKNNYVVEILTGSFDPDDTVRCYRDSAYSNDSETGRGKVRRYPDYTVSGQGRITAVKIQEGSTVKAGDLLFETADILAVPDSSNTINATVAGVLSALYVNGGQQVYRGQLLAEILQLGHLELSIELDEMDLPSIHIGDTLSYTLDAYPDKTFSGTVSKIYPIGTQKQNAAYFDVRLQISTDAIVLYPGMNGTVTIP